MSMGESKIQADVAGAPAEKSPGEEERTPAGGLLLYTAGLGFALLLTGASFLVAQSHLLWSPGVPVGLAVLAIAQMGVHLVFFLHLSTGPDNTNNVIALTFGLLVVTLIVSGTLWIMAHLDANMLPASALMQMAR